MFTNTFTDPQGVDHVDAVFEVATANYNTNTHSNYEFELSQGDNIGNPVTHEDSSAHLSYQMFYWASQEARDAGCLPYYLSNVESSNDHFYVPDNLLTGPDFATLTVAEKAEKHCKEVVLGITE